MFHAANISESTFLSISELSNLLTHTIGHKFSIAACRKVMREIDVDRDDYLCLLDVLAVLHLAEAYLSSMAGEDNSKPVLLLLGVKYVKPSLRTLRIEKFVEI